MQLRIQSRGFELDPKTRQELARRIRMCLGRHAEGIAVAKVLLSPSPPTHGERAKQCEIRLQMRKGEGFRLHEQDTDLPAATLRAAQRAGKRLDREGLRKRLLAGAEGGFADGIHRSGLVSRGERP